MAWGVIANVARGDWTKETPEWQAMAHQWGVEAGFRMEDPRQPEAEAPRPPAAPSPDYSALAKEVGCMQCGGNHPISFHGEEPPRGAAAGEERDKCQFCLGAKGGVRGNENVFAGKIIVCDFCTGLALDIEAQAREEGRKAGRDAMCEAVIALLRERRNATTMTTLGYLEDQVRALSTKGEGGE